MKYLEDLNFQNKRVLLRADLNVPLDEAGEIADDHRIKQVLPTIQRIIGGGASVVLMSHFDRPGGIPDPKFSLNPVAKRLSELLEREVPLAADCVGPEVESQAAALAPGDLLMLENLRFHSGERKNDHEFAAHLARLGNVYVNDAFATAHRSHASVVGVPSHFAEKAAGLLMQKEIEYYEKALVKPSRPLCVVLGGAKVSTKLNLLMHILDKADKIIIGGAMANTFIAAQGAQIGKSLVERELFPKALEILATLARRGCQLYLPVDFVAASSLNSSGDARAVPVQELPADLMALDIGPASSLLFREALQTVETIIWNGPMGAFEKEAFAEGTTSMVESIAAAQALKVVGGGDTDAAIHQMELEHKFDFISTGGGAFLAQLEGEQLVAFRALEG